MKIGLKLFAIFLMVATFSSCKSSSENTTQGSESTDMEEAGNSTSLFELETEACRGTCPVYSLSIDKEGNMVYNGMQHVANLGQFTYTLDNQQMNSLISLLDQSDFGQLQDEYVTGARDIPRIKMSYLGKSVMYQKNAAPERLLAIQSKMESLVNKIDMESLNGE